MDSRVAVIASRTRTHRTLTVQRDERSQVVACSGSSLAQNIGAIGPLQGAEDLAHRDLGGCPCELVAAVGAARAHDEPGVAQVHDELLEVGARQVLFRGDPGEARRPGPVVARELDHQPHAVFALRGEGDGPRAVVGRALGGLRLDGLGVAAGGGGQGGRSSISE